MIYAPETQLDGYKLGHRDQYPRGITEVESNLTPRTSRNPEHTHVVWFALQYFIQRRIVADWTHGFFNQPIAQVVARYTRRVQRYLGADTVDTSHLEALHALGYLPLEFRALPEGTLVPLRVAPVTVRNTHPDFAWLTNYIETILSCEVWQPSTSATTAMYARLRLERYARLTGSPLAFVDWQNHDFSMRGMGGLDAAAASGAGHLLSGLGTDTVPVFDFIETYYSPEDEAYSLAGSVNATEHAVMCAGGEDDEYATYRRLLTEVYPTGIVSIVSDTWDLWHVITVILVLLKDEIMARDGKLVIRPDSGDPVKIICGDPDAPVGSPAHKGVVELLWEIFGGTVTDTGHRLLDSHIGVIYGDSINAERMEAILAGLAAKGFASANMVFGSGSFTYQYVTRDTYGWAMKATNIIKDGVDTPIFKRPATDDGTKNSARGRTAVLRDAEGELYQVDMATPAQRAACERQRIWMDGEFEVYVGYDDVRATLAANVAAWQQRLALVAA